jgi:chromosome segregation ATPase
MKNILYIVAIVAILAGGWFSYKQKSEFQELQEQREDLDDTNENRKASTKTFKKKAKGVAAELDTAKGKLSDAEAGLDNANSKLKITAKDAATWSSKIDGQAEKLEGVNALIATIKDEFKDLGPVELSEIPALIQKLEEDLKKANEKPEELAELIAAAESRVASNDSQIKDLDARIAKRAERIKGNSAHARVTAVNHDWGFVTMEVPSNMPLTPVSQLMVKRGMSYVGNLNINAIEGRRVVADIDYRSMRSGMVIQPGDHVILIKPATN